MIFIVSGWRWSCKNQNFRNNKKCEGFNFDIQKKVTNILAQSFWKMLTRNTFCLPLHKRKKTFPTFLLTAPKKLPTIKITQHNTQKNFTLTLFYNMFPDNKKTIKNYAKRSSPILRSIKILFAIGAKRKSGRAKKKAWNTNKNLPKTNQILYFLIGAGDQKNQQIILWTIKKLKGGITNFLHIIIKKHFWTSLLFLTKKYFNWKKIWQKKGKTKKYPEIASRIFLELKNKKKSIKKKAKS